MPLRFRSVVPYTLPGVLALIGWWWYISRKKERLISRDSQDGDPALIGLKTSPAEGSNGLVERASVSPKNDTEIPMCRHLKVINQKTEDENISHIHVQDTEATPLSQEITEKATPDLGMVRQNEIHNPPGQSIGKEDSVPVSERDYNNSEKSPPLVLVTQLEEHLIKDEPSAARFTLKKDTLQCKSTKFTCVSPTTAHLSKAERPDPEGEVSNQHISTNAQNEKVVAPAKIQSMIPSETDYFETPPLMQDSHEHILTSTPTALTQTSRALSTVQDSITTSLTTENIQKNTSSAEDQDLEHLAAGLITEVISAATQAVLGVTSSQITDGNQPSCSSSTSLAGNRLCFQQEPIAAPQKAPHLLKSYESREATLKEGEEMLNECSSVPVWEPVEFSHSVQQNNAQRSYWPIPTHQAAQNTFLLNMKLKGDETAVMAEASACSTCHSKDGISIEDTQSNVFDNQKDVIQVTDLSARDVSHPQSLAEIVTGATVLTVTEQISTDAVCVMKRLNGLGLNNGAHGTCEVETDHSGGSDVNSMDSVDSSYTMGSREGQSNHAASSNSELIIWEIEVPKHLVGRLIGKQGRYVSFLKQSSGAKIYISTLPYTQEFQICHIEGTQQQVDKALSLVGKKFKDLDLTNLYSPPPPQLTLPSLPMTSWLLLPSGVTIEVIVVNIVSAGHVFVQQHTHPTYHALRSLDQQMFLCYSQPGTPALPSPAEVGVICAAPAAEGAWWRAQVITFYKDTNEVEIRYVDYGGYDRVKIDALRQIRSDFVTLPFQGAEVLLDNIVPLPGEDRFSVEATSALEEMTRGVALLAQVSNYDNNTGLPLVHLWNMVGDEVISVNRTLVERGLGSWVDGY
ncbi:A-kinase anchor protein 1, mitochondrial [Channa argus]|uniref:A-kinase anchor protein 1, mitochondrial n=1 Tax=Channa argus TaxID=215402 RepID=A0A6G1PQG0_CHAAH|nr:A-kinase anchor protein 1, mitochondrial [Channa argus]